MLFSDLLYSIFQNIPPDKPVLIYVLFVKFTLQPHYNILSHFLSSKLYIFRCKKTRFRIISIRNLVLIRYVIRKSVPEASA